MNLKKTALVMLSLSVLLLTAGRIEPSSAEAKKEHLVVIDSHGKETVTKFKHRTNDEVFRKLDEQYDVNALSPEDDVMLDPSIPLAINWSDVKGEFKHKIKELIDSNYFIYFYSDSLTIKDIERTFNIILDKNNDEDEKIKKETEAGNKTDITDVSRQIIGFSKQSNDLYLSNIQISTDKSPEGIAPSKNPDTFVQTILNRDVQRLENESNKQIVTKMGYQDDPIVKSHYNVNDTYYLNSKQIGDLNTFWILHQNTQADNDPTYDYFYLEHSIQVTASNGAHNFLTHIYHSLPYSSDVLRDFGPKSTTTSTFQVGLPWSVSWQFTVNSGNDALALTANGGQSTGKADWAFSAPWYYIYMANPATMKPGTAWASKANVARYAAIDTKVVATLDAGNIGYMPQMQVSDNVRYSY